MIKIHTIPVPEGWSIEQAWEAISRGDKIPTEKQSWANVQVDDEEKFVRVIQGDAEL